MLSSVISVTVISLLGMLSPGPDFFLVLKNAARYSRAAALTTVAGIVCAVIVHMTYCVLGLAIIIAQTPWLFNIIRYSGAAYLIYLGIKALRSQNHYTLQAEAVQKQEISLKAAFLQGFLCNLLNPKATLFFLAVFTQVIDIHTGLWEKIAYAGIIVGLAVLYWPILVYLIQHAAVKRCLNSIQNQVDKLLGGVLILFGIKVALS